MPSYLSWAPEHEQSLFFKCSFVFERTTQRGRGAPPAGSFPKRPRLGQAEPGADGRQHPGLPGVWQRPKAMSCPLPSRVHMSRKLAQPDSGPPTQITDMSAPGRTQPLHQMSQKLDFRGVGLGSMPRSLWVTTAEVGGRQSPGPPLLEVCAVPGLSLQWGFQFCFTEAGQTSSLSPSICKLKAKLPPRCPHGSRKGHGIQTEIPERGPTL